MAKRERETAKVPEDADGRLCAPASVGARNVHPRVKVKAGQSGRRLRAQMTGKVRGEYILEV